MIVRDVLDSGLRLVTEAMPHVRSVSIGVWLTRGSRHEDDTRGGIAHFVEHMLFKGTERRSAEDIAQQVDSVGGQLDAFTSKEYAGYYIRVLDEHLPLALDILSDLVTSPRFDPGDIEKEKGVILEEIKMVEDTPDDLVVELFVEHFWPGHPLGRPILGTPATIEAFTRDGLREYFASAYTANNFVVTAAGHLEHDELRHRVAAAFAGAPAMGVVPADRPPVVSPPVVVRTKDLEQSHVCLGTRAYPQDHADRHAAFVLNSLLGGSMSSRLFQNIRERHGLAYSVASGLASYRDTGMFNVYAGCANDRVGRVIDLVVDELRQVKAAPVPAPELRRAKDHLKGNILLGLESSSNRMVNLARQEIYFGHPISTDESLAELEAVTGDDVQRVAAELFNDGALGVTVLGPDEPEGLTAERLSLG
ncbi:MAG: insulinase family protein [Vicinamibacteraceae bacterium]|nr:insulinase family protein [Vicinamibacteraceae bacterium]